jgi:hypothetical protein
LVQGRRHCFGSGRLEIPQSRRIQPPIDLYPTEL